MALRHSIIFTLLLTLLTLPPPELEAKTSPLDPEARLRVEILLDPTALPPADRERAQDRINAIETALASGLPLFRSFDARETLADALAELERLGADLGPDATVNFDTLELEVPMRVREAIAALPWVRSVGPPLYGTPSGVVDSEGLTTIGAGIAHAAGITGQGITVAIIDDSFDHLKKTIASGELPTIPTNRQHRINASNNTVITPFDLDGAATQPLEGEHGTACAEVVYEVAPGVNFLLMGFAPHAPGAQFAGWISAPKVEHLIRRAADLGAKVILVPIYMFRTMSDPVGTAQGGRNTFTDDIDYATAAGATVVVSAGNEALRHVEETFTPCSDCTAASGLCTTAENDTSYHAWNPGVDALPLNDLLASNEADSAERYEVLACYSATDAADPSRFEMQTIRTYYPVSECEDEGNCPGFCQDEAVCPNDCGTNKVQNGTQDLGQGFSRKTLSLYDSNGNGYGYFLSVRFKGATSPLCQAAKCIQDGTTACSSDADCESISWPSIRLSCTTGVAELYHYTNTGKNLSDLAVVSNALAVGAVGANNLILPQSSYGPTGLPGGPIKPDLVGPGVVSNFTVLTHRVSESPFFVGSSAAAAHVAGVVALVQSDALATGGQLLSPAQVKSLLRARALDLGAPGDDVVYGAGMVRVPFMVPPECGNGLVEDGEQCDDGDLENGDCCSASCGFEPAGSTCSAATPCKGASTCDGAGQCVPGEPVDCSDEDPCTRDSCDPATGCTSTPAPASTCSNWEVAMIGITEKVAGREKLLARLRTNRSVSTLDFGNPLAPGGTNYATCLYNGSGRLAGRIEVDRAGSSCGNRPCWRSRPRGTGFFFATLPGRAMASARSSSRVGGWPHRDLPGRAERRPQRRDRSQPGDHHRPRRLEPRHPPDLPGRFLALLLGDTRPSQPKRPLFLRRSRQLTAAHAQQSRG